MKALELMNPAHIFVEIGQDWLKAFNGTSGLELPVERSANGRLTEACKTNLSRSLRSFIQHKSWQPRPQAFCALAARGVSLRRLSLPAGSKEELHRLLPLQIESEFPLPPDQLAWGCQVFNGATTPLGTASGKQEVLVAAVKKETLEDYTTLFAMCGVSPVFTLAALARSYVCPQPPCPYAVLAIDQSYSELISFEAGVPVGVRVLPWGSNNLAAVNPDPRGVLQTTPLLPGSAAKPSSFGCNLPAPAASSVDPADALAHLINGQAAGRRIYIVGASSSDAGLTLAARLSQRLNDGANCLPVELALSQTGSAAILGLHKILGQPQGWPPLVLQVKQINGKVSRMAQEAPLKWAAAIVLLLLVALLLPYAEALTLKAHLAKKLASIKADQGRLTTMDRELDFLQYLEQNQPPYLDALLVLAKAAPPGTRFDSVSMNRRGELSLRGSLHDGQQVAELRAKLIDSGFFDSVGIEEQTPSPDRQKVAVRMNAQWKLSASRIKPGLEPGRATGSKRLPNEPSASPAPANLNSSPAPKAGATKKGQG